MRYRLNYGNADIADTIKWLDSRYGTLLRQRVTKIEREAEKSFALREHYETRYPLEYQLGKCLDIAQLPINLWGREKKIALGFAYNLKQVHQRLTAAGQKRLDGMVNDSLSSQEQGLIPLQLELETGSALIRAGFDVDFADLEGRTGGDLIGTKNGLKIAVECKCLSKDAGRKIRQVDVRRLATALNPALAHLTEAGGCHILHIRLAKGQKSTLICQQAVHADLIRILQQPGAITTPDLTAISERVEQPIPRNPAEAYAAVAQIAVERFGSDNKHIMFDSCENGLAILAVDSEDDDAVVKAIEHRLREAAGQCDPKLPGFIIIRITDLARTDIADIASDNGGLTLQRIAEKTFAGKNGARLHTIAFLPRSDIAIAAEWQEGGAPVLLFRNKAHPRVEDPSLRPFDKTPLGR